MTAKTPSKEMFAHLPVGRSTTVRVLLIAGALLTAVCVLWIQQLRLSGSPYALAPIFFVLFSFFDYGAAMLALGILLVAMFVPQWNGFNRLLRWMGERPYPIAAAVAVLLSVGALVIYHNQPLSMDEYAPVFQSQAFASGRLSGRFPVDLLNLLIPENFQNFFLTLSKTTGDVSSSYWPSFALLLTPFTLFGIPWACNGVLSGVTVVVLNRLAKRLFQSAEAAGLVTLFTIASPVFFADGISYYSMTSHLLANAIFVLLLLQPSTGRLVAAGVVGSIALTLHNPVPHALFALPWFVWLATQEKPVAKLGALCAGYLPLSLLLGLGWFLYLEQLKHSGVPATGGTAGLHEALSVFGLPNATVLYARLIGLAKVLLWSAPCLMLLAIAGAWRSRADSRLLTLAACALLTLAGYLFFPADQGHGWGFRYFHSAWLALPLLATAFMFAPAKAEQPRRPEPETLSPAAADVRSYVVACALLSLVAAVGLRASQINEFMSDHLHQYPRYAGAEPRVVVQSGEGFYPLDLVQNDPFLRKDIVRMISVGQDETAAAIQKHFPTYHRVYADVYGEVWSAAPVVPAVAQK
ncbi:MAG: hypothetical protein WDO68_22440 [Gammaproteobacteria bacterium]